MAAQTKALQLRHHPKSCIAVPAGRYGSFQGVHRYNDRYIPMYIYSYLISVSLQGNEHRRYLDPCLSGVFTPAERREMPRRPVDTRGCHGRMCCAEVGLLTCFLRFVIDRLDPARCTGKPRQGVAAAWESQRFCSDCDLDAILSSAGQPST